MSAGLTNDTIQDALQRAKELAAATQHIDSQKRPADDDLKNLYPAKRSANGMDMAGNPIATLGGIPNNLNVGTAEVIIETIEVPDNTVGLVIGRGGEQITQIQAQSGCRVQMSPDADGHSMRQCTLQGTKYSVEKAKQLIYEVINRAGNRPPPGRSGGFDAAAMMAGGGRTVTFEMQLPGSKCGLVIGKGGETIKNIQESAGVKMILIQESQEAGHGPKPLRIIGDPEKVEHAKRLVEDIINSRDDHPPSQQRFSTYGGGGSPMAMTGGGPKSIGEVIVPRSSVGMIIGKGGETIKRLAVETGAKIQFKPDDDPSTPDRCAVIQGTADQIAKATQYISDLVNKSGAGGGSEIFYMHVPSNKTGLVIGKGGETIKQICGESGAHVELSREPPPNAAEKIFIIRGTPMQIHHAQHIIRIKVGDIAPGTPVPPYHGATNDFQHAGAYGGAQFGAAQQTGGWSTFGAQQSDPNAAAWAQYYNQQQYGGYQQYQQTTTAQAQQQSQSTAAPSINPQTGQPDYSAQWAEYYRTMGMHEQANLIDQQLKQNAAAAAAAQNAQSAAAQQQQATRPQQQPGFGAYAGAAQGQFSYGAPAGAPAAGYQFQQQY
jgi:far upstream element-binding protein